MAAVPWARCVSLILVILDVNAISTWFNCRGGGTGEKEKVDAALDQLCPMPIMNDCLNRFKKKLLDL